jgi:dihydrofolate reductase
MGKVIAGATLSVDGFMADRNGDLSQLYPDLETLRFTDQLEESIRTTGAVLMGRRAYTMGDPETIADNYEYQIPIFVLTHSVPEQLPRENERLAFTFVTDGIESAMRQAKAAAGEKDVTVVGGASTFQQCLSAGLVDELHIDVMPVLLGDGLRLFGRQAAELPRLERLAVMELPAGRTHISFRIVK